MSSYALGTSEAAAQRLGEVAKFFNPWSNEFVADVRALSFSVISATP